MPLSNPTPPPGGRVGFDVHTFLAELKKVDLLQVGWTEDGQRKGIDVFIPPLAANAHTLSIGVRNQHEAFALRKAKIAVDMGDTLAAYMALTTLAVPGSPASSDLCGVQ